jgi:uncharacterized protein DUF3108
MPAWCRLVVLGLLASLPHVADGEETAALYQVYWAGMPVGEISLASRQDGARYHDEVTIGSQGLARLATRFRASAASDGQLGAALPLPTRYDALYDLRSRRSRRLSMRFVTRDGVVVADRGADDTSRKPPLAERFRTNVVDPLSALTAIRLALRRGMRGSFSVPVYDGARRFDILVRLLPRPDDDRAFHLALTLAPIAGFKGETSDDGDPDDAPRPVALTISNDQRLLPLLVSTSLYYVPLVVELTRLCDTAPCGQ